MTTFSSDTGLVTLYSAASLRDRLHGVQVSFLEELFPAILKFYRFFGGRVDVTASFTGTSGVGVGICTTMFDRNAASLGEADLVCTICNKCSYQAFQYNKVL
ncbi:hypothetical protein PIB30_049611 [Stylosanthes scabra]|uniref:Uncharacterized protein n=1 Tax=Stylosanthes scabra TaxID=79078 RepID=A0ABU6XF26_9FABA|nr:hypothetical protein [Stylosanthes scabra]